MSQTSYIAAFIIIGFIVFITIRGELRQYLDVLGIGSTASDSAKTTKPNLTGIREKLGF